MFKNRTGHRGFIYLNLDRLRLVPKADVSEGETRLQPRSKAVHGKELNPSQFYIFPAIRERVIKGAKVRAVFNAPFTTWQIIITTTSVAAPAGRSQGGRQKVRGESIFWWDTTSRKV